MENTLFKAYENLEFLNSHDARPIRVLCELVESSVRLEKENISNTIVFFGSARSKPSYEAGDDLDNLFGSLPEPEHRTEEQKKQLQKAESLAALSPYYDDAVALSQKLSTWSKESFSPNNQFHICSGGGPGMMEAANKGASQANAKSVALGISLPFEQGVNEFATPELAFEFHYFFIRKFYFLYHAKAVVAFPGGFGTMDELFEVLTLIQTKKIGKRIPIYLYGKDFWSKLIDFKQFVEFGVISPEDLELFKMVDEVDEAFELITADLQRTNS
tara:strand:- start:1192 stop:2010 length:819 start_codon:yes stop_codon:yes gene_type:complete